MKKTKLSQAELLSLMKQGRRLETKPPKIETPKKAYKRKAKHKRRYDDASSSFVEVSSPFSCVENKSFTVIMIL